MQTPALRPPNGLVTNAWSQPCAVLRLRLSDAIKRVATIAQAMSCNGFVQKRGARAMNRASYERLQPTRFPNAKRRGPEGVGRTGASTIRRQGKLVDRKADDIARRMVEVLPRLRRFAASLTHDRNESEDLVQETCARALAHLDQWRPDSRLDSWMYRIAQNLWIDQKRMQKARGEVVDIEAIEDLSGCDGRLVIENRWYLFELRDCIAQLPASQRALLGLVCVDGLSYKEAAQVLDSPEGTIMSRLARARDALHQATAGRADVRRRRPRPH